MARQDFMGYESEPFDKSPDPAPEAYRRSVREGYGDSQDPAPDGPIVEDDDDDMEALLYRHLSEVKARRAAEGSNDQA